MRFSCNGCRVLRKGCSEDCCIRPCLQWIKSPKAQANATLFLAKFYGRAGLLNLINAGPEHLRPSIFKSLLQEACGRIVNPIYGSSGLISTGGWHLCEAAVEAVLSGLPITQISIETAVENANPLFKACDIRHIPKKSTEVIHKVNNRTLFKRSKSKPKKVEPVALMGELSGVDSVGHDGSRVSQSGGSDSGSVETVEDTLAKPNKENEFGLDLTLGFEKAQALGTVEEENDGSESCDESSWKCELTLGLPELC